MRLVKSADLKTVSFDAHGFGCLIKLLARFAGDNFTGIIV
jgi:hypothetical protein